MPLSPFSLPDLEYGNAVPDYRLSDARSYFRLEFPALGLSLDIHEPTGLDNAEWTIQRDSDWHGLNFEFIGDQATLKFHQAEAITFIENAYQKSGPNGNVLLKWGLVDASGELELHNVRLILSKRNKKGDELTIPCERVSLHPDIKAKWDTTLSMDQAQSLVNDVNNVPVSITPPSPSVLVLHSQRILQTTTLKNIENAIDTDWQSFANVGASILQGGSLIPAGTTEAFHFFYIKFPFESARASPNEVGGFVGSSGVITTPYPPDNADYILKATANGKYTIDIKVDFQVDARLQKASISINPPEIVEYELKYFLIVGSTVREIKKKKSGNPNSRFLGVIREAIDYTEVFDVVKNDPIYLYAQLYLRPDRNNWRGTDVRVMYFSASLTISANTYAPASSCPAYPVIDVLRQWVACLTGRQNAVQSSYYSFSGDNQPVDGGGAHRMRTNGYYLRGFTGKPMQNSLQKELSSLQAIDAIGVSYKPTDDGDVLVVEPIANWYRDTEILTLENYTIVEEQTALEYLHPSVDVGYSKFPNEGAQVLDDFNTKQEYTLPMRDGTPYEAVSDLIASGYALELTRRAQFSETPLDSTSYDDDNFIICSSQLAKLTPEQSAVTVPVTFVTVSGLARLAFALDQKPAWFSKGLTFLVSGTAHNNGLFKIVDYVDSNLFGVARAIAVLDRAITNEAVTATLSISTSASFQAERNEDFAVVEGVVDPATTYNLRLSPRFNLLRHAPYIAGGLTYNNGSEPIRCTFSKNNGILRTQLRDNAAGDNNIDSRKLIQHNDSFFLAGLRSPISALWTPETVKVSTKLTIDQMLYLRATLTGTHPDNSLHYGFITLANGDASVRGFPLQISFKPASGEAMITLLKKRVTLSEKQGSFGCSFYSNFTFADFQALPSGTLANWIEECTFDNFS